MGELLSGVVKKTIFFVLFVALLLVGLIQGLPTMAGPKRQLAKS